MNQDNKAIYTFTEFTPQEAAELTGVNVNLQRDWRRRGFLPKVTGHARFDLFTLAEMKVMKALSDFGVPQDVRQQVAPLCALGVAYNTLWQATYSLDQRVFTGNWNNWWDYAFSEAAIDFELVSEERQRQLGPITVQQSLYEHAISTQYPKSMELDFHRYTLQDLRRFIFKDLMKLGRCTVEFPELYLLSGFLIITSDGCFHWVLKLDELVSEDNSNPVSAALRKGAAIVIDADLFAVDLAETTPKPFLQINVPEGVDHGQG